MLWFISTCAAAVSESKPQTEIRSFTFNVFPLFCWVTFIPAEGTIAMVHARLLRECVCCVCAYVCARARHMECKAYASMSGHFELVSYCVYHIYPYGLELMCVT